MKKHHWAFVVLAMSSIAWAGKHNNNGGGGGGEVPSPYDSSNQKVELSDREKYSIEGVIVMGPSIDGSGGQQPYIQVDLKAQPWLANHHRVAFPYYPLEVDTSKLDRLDRVEGEVIVTGDAHTRIVSTSQGDSYQIFITVKKVDSMKSIY